MVTLITSYIFILAMSAVIFTLVKKSRPEFIEKEELKLWIKFWYLITSIAFITHHVWLTYFLLIILFKNMIKPIPIQRITCSMALLFALPMLPMAIPGAAGIRYIINLDYPLFLYLNLFLPILFGHYARRNKKKISTDTYLLIYIIILIILNFRDNTFTNALRSSVIDILKIYVPYSVISNYVTTKEQLNKILFALFLGLIPLSLIGIFEAVKHWHVYDKLSMMMTNKGPQANRYDVRAGLLRASPITEGPIMYSYIMLINVGLTLYLKIHLKTMYYVLFMVFSVGGMFVTSARGTWVGCVLMLVMYTLTSKGAITKIIKMTTIGVGSIVLLSFTEFGQKFINLLPIIGNTRSDTIEYREKLMEIAWIVFKKSPWLGSPNFMDDPALEVMRQGQGIIDIVNSYIQVALSSGGIGLLFFLLIFLSLIRGCFFMTKKLPNTEVELINMGKVLFAMLVATAMTIFSVSSIDYIPVMYWTLISIAAAYLKVCNKTIKRRARG